MKKKNVYLIIIFLIISSFIAFSPVAKNEFINFDDDVYITENTHIQSGFNLENIQWAFSTFHRSYWHPLTWMSHMLDWQLFGNDAGGHHLVSLLLHIGTAILLFLFLHKTTGNLWPAAFAAAFFALHPLRVESVAWASERKDVLSMFFGMASVYAYAFYAERTSISRYGLCLLLFIFSLMSKPMWVTLPFALLLLDYWPLGRIRKAFSLPGENKLKSVGMLVWEKVPFLVPAAAVSLLAIFAQNQIGAMAKADSIPFDARLSNAIFSYAAYLGKIFWPTDLAVYYPYDVSLIGWKVLLAGLGILFFMGVVLCYFRKLPFLFVGWFWYLGTLVPVIGLIQVGSQAMADRYTYLPSIGICMMLTWGTLHFISSESMRRNLVLPAAAILLSVLLILTFHQCGYWKNSITLFSQAIKMTRNNDKMHHNMGTLFYKEGNLRAALDHFSRAIHIHPNYLSCNSRGVIYARAGMYQQALSDFNKSISLKADNPNGYYNRALTYHKMGDYRQATEDFTTALSLQPGNIQAYTGRGNAYFSQGNHKFGCRDAGKACSMGECGLMKKAQDQGLCR